MLRRVLAFTLAAGIVSLTSTGHAAVKTTPPLQKGGSDAFNCRVLNTGPKPLSGITVRILNSVGSVLEESTFPTLFVGATASDTYTGGQTIAYCQVEGSFPRKRVLVTFCVLRSGETICEAAVGDPGL